MVNVSSTPLSLAPETTLNNVSLFNTNKGYVNEFYLVFVVIAYLLSTRFFKISIENNCDKVSINIFSVVRVSFRNLRLSQSSK